MTATGVGGCTGTVSRTFTVEGPPAPDAEMADEITLADGEEGARPEVAVGMAPRLALQATATLTVNLMGTGTGNVASAPAGLSCSGGRGVSCTGTFAVDTVVTLVATPEAGATFGGWGGACGGTGGCQVTVTQASLVVASFVVPPPTVTQYYHLDALGSVRAVTDVNGGLIRRHDYATFGENLDQAGSEPQPLPALAKQQRFTGKEHDGETELTYFGARYYRNTWGRFTTVDPGHVGGNVFDPQSWNAYAYAWNNPLRFVDPTRTDYFVEIEGGSDFWFEGGPINEFGQFKAFAAGFRLEGGMWGGTIYNAAGVKSAPTRTPTKLSTWRRTSPAVLRGLSRPWVSVSRSRRSLWRSPIP